MTKGIILSGGWGTRLRPLTCTIPKTLIPVVNKPVMERQILLLKDAGVKEIVLAVSVMSEVIQSYFKDGSKLGVKIHYTDEKFPAGTAGAMKLAEEFLIGDKFFMLNGDVILNFDFSKMRAFHERKGGIGTIASKIVHDPSRYGVLLADKNTNKIDQFLEKENYTPPNEGLHQVPINAGVYLLEPEILDQIPPNRKVSIERDVFPEIAMKHTLYHYPIEGIWKDVGNPIELLQGNLFLMNDLLKSNQTMIENGLKIHQSSKIIQPCAIAKNVVIKENCTIGPDTVIGNDVNIDSGTKIKESIIFNGSQISKNVKIQKAIISENCFIGENASLIGQEDRLIILSSHVKVLDNIQLINTQNTTYSVCHHELVTEDLKKKNS